MTIDYQIAEPILFNPLKHHLGFIKDYMGSNIDANGTDEYQLLKDLKHVGSSVMDVYTGCLSVKGLCYEILEFLGSKNLITIEAYHAWIEKSQAHYHIAELSDGSSWTYKFHNNPSRFVHVFPARNSPHTFRVKANTLKSALIYTIIVGKDLVTGKDLNRARTLLDLSPVKYPGDTEAIMEMIEILRGS